MSVHETIQGYREINPHQAALISEIKGKANEIGDLIERLNSRGTKDEVAEQTFVDRRLLSIARTQLQLGFMALERSVYRHAGF